MNIQSSQHNWDHLAQEDALFMVLSYKSKRGRKWEPDDFFRTGTQEVEQDLISIRRVYPQLKFGKALDFGCGVGRLTQALAEKFQEIHGLDVSPQMVKMAYQYKKYPNKCSFHAIAANKLEIFPDNYFDLVYSKITLQHIKPVYSKQYIAEFTRVLNPGGILYFQLTSEPTELTKPATFYQQVKSFLPPRINEFLRDLKYRNRGRIDMYGIPKEKVITLLQQNGITLMEIQPDPITGPNWHGFIYCGVKRKF